MYMDENNDIMPDMPATSLGSITKLWQFRQTWQYKLIQYDGGGKTALFDCPAQEKNSHGSNILSTYGPCDYCVNGYYSHGRDDISAENPILGGPGLGLSASDILLLVDSTCSYLYVWSTTSHISTVHHDGTGANVLHLDLHVEGPELPERYANGEGYKPTDIYPNHYY
jgi:prepilin-type processing-associated H-X9-DG protein